MEVNSQLFILLDPNKDFASVLFFIITGSLSINNCITSETAQLIMFVLNIQVGVSCPDLQQRVQVPSWNGWGGGLKL